jgi:predicted nucleic acid-binding protein
MTVTFDTNVLVYATALPADLKSMRARELMARAMRAESGVLLLQSLAEFSSVAMRKAGIRVEAVKRIVDAWQAVLPVEAAQRDDLITALDAVSAHKLSFWDALLWATACRVGVRHMLTEDFQDGFRLDTVKFINPFRSANDDLIEAILPG